MMSRRAELLALSMLLSSWSCGSSTAVCTTEGHVAVAVFVRDARTGAPAGAGAMLVARSGAYADTVRNAISPFGDSLSLPAGRRAGTYDLTVTKPGYQTWTQTGVNVSVSRARCGGIETVVVEARLLPSP